MTQRTLSIDIKHARLLKNADLVLITGQDGTICASSPGFGLFYRDCRYLSGYRLSLGNTSPFLLMSASREGFAADLELTNAALKSPNRVPVHTIGIKREQVLIDTELALVEVITFRNYGKQSIVFPVELTLAANFESMFVLRGTPPGRRGRMYPPHIKDNRIRFLHRGADEVARSLDVAFSWIPEVAPRRSAGTVAHFELGLASQESKSLQVSLHVRETSVKRRGEEVVARMPTTDSLRAYRLETARGWLDGFSRFHGADRGLNGTLERSLSDLRLLRIVREGEPCMAAGLPWFVGVFGRDSVIPALQCLAFNPEIAEHTARSLARHQGRKTDAKRHEEPGKILHEWRVGEMARLHEVPEISYASIDSTLLFLILIARHASWTGTLTLFDELRGNVDRALDWIARSGDRNEDGYIEYYGKTKQGSPVNQGWKDSGDAIVRHDGSFPDPPISLVEVQGYLYLARIAMAELFERAGDNQRSERLIREAASLHARFNRDFWMEEAGCYCLGLEGDGRQIAVIASNAGQALWSGIAARDKALKTSERLMQNDMFSGWGIRTLSCRESRYNPFAYQLGSIWPFDNSLILAGLRRYGLDAAACRIFSGTLAAAEGFADRRLPEFFAGTGREPGLSPAHCPRADPLQAWSAGAVPFMLAELLGLQPNGFEVKLKVVRPVLPDHITHMDLLGIRVGGGSADLRFTRSSAGPLAVDVLRVAGGLKIEVTES